MYDIMNGSLNHCRKRLVSLRESHRVTVISMCCEPELDMHGDPIVCIIYTVSEKLFIPEGCDPNKDFP